MYRCMYVYMHLAVNIEAITLGTAFSEKGYTQQQNQEAAKK